ncbi:MAG TPA: hypothetical protein VEM41_10560 [Actinomycetota bacterium]|nr:hypothetical protein [Actinomycetota bacterium]
MRPRFNAVTQILAAGFIVAGIAEGLAALHASRQPATSTASGDTMTTFVVALGLAATGFCMWAEYVWAWWTGLVVAVFMVATSAAIARDIEWVPWSLFIVAFGISFAQGLFDFIRARRSAHTGVEAVPRH